jgi:hypothetical protein
VTLTFRRNPPIAAFNVAATLEGLIVLVPKMSLALTNPSSVLSDSVVDVTSSG